MFQQQFQVIYIVPERFSVAELQDIYACCTELASPYQRGPQPTSICCNGSIQSIVCSPPNGDIVCSPPNEVCPGMCSVVLGDAFCRNVVDGEGKLELLLVVLVFSVFT